MTEKQKRFCDEYLIDCNGTRAYKAAYQNVKNGAVIQAENASLTSENVTFGAYTLPAFMVNSIGGAWDVEFLNRDGSTLKKAGFGKLQGFEKSADPDIRYFSGTAVYRKTFEFHGNGSGQYILDLGKVFNMAHVYLNGVDLGLAWKVPYRPDVSEALMDGDNRLEVRVINSWVNRLIGDEQPGAARSTYIAYRQYWPEDELLPSGLLGPVRIVAVR